MAHDELAAELLSELPTTISSLIKEIVEDEPEAKVAITRIIDELRASDEYEAIVDLLVYKGVSSLVWRYRGFLNREKKKVARQIPSTPEPAPRRIPVTVDPGKPKYKAVIPLVVKAYRIGYNWCIGGKRLGKMTVADLDKAIVECSKQRKQILSYEKTWREIRRRLKSTPELTVDKVLSEEEIDEIFWSFGGE